MPNYQQFASDIPLADRSRAVDNILKLRQGLAAIPSKLTESNLLLASWNIREFDKPSYGPRIPEAMYYIAEIVSRFDLIAIQEVYKDLKALYKLLDILGPNWKYITTDASGGDAGNDERLAFVYDTRKVKFGGVAGELVFPELKQKDPATGIMRIVQPRQLARTPFMCGFSANWADFVITTVHILYGENTADDAGRLREIQSLVQDLAARTIDPTEWSRNFILLGDFNIFSPADATFKAITDAGFRIPPELQNLPSNALRNKYYDQIAVFDRERKFEFSGKAGVFDFTQIVFRDQDEGSYVSHMGDAYLKTSDGKPRKNQSQYYKTYWRTFQMSDHLPMWAEINIDYSEDFLKRSVGG